MVHGVCGNCGECYPVTDLVKCHGCNNDVCLECVGGNDNRCHFCGTNLENIKEQIINNIEKGG